jgi:hypothetical protein
MAIGDSQNIFTRVLGVIPRWWQFGAPNRKAVMGGLSDIAASLFSFITYAGLQARLATATSVWLDIFSFDFLGRNLLRNGATDSVFRTQIQATILQERVTRAGMVQAITTLTGNAPSVFEPWNTGDTGAYQGASGKVYGTFGYGVGRGGYGSLNLPAQVFMKVLRGNNSGVPNVDGYGGFAGGYGVGSIEYVGSFVRTIGVTDQIIEQTIQNTRPTGTTVWLQIS